MLKQAVIGFTAVIAFLLGAYSASIVSATSGGSVAQGASLPETPAVGNRLFIYGHAGRTECPVQEVSGNWVRCNATWNNLVTGAAYVIQSKQ